MGGRGSSSGMSKYGNPYGSQYHALLEIGSVKFVEKSTKGSETLMETATPGRVYAYVNPQGKLSSLTMFDGGNMRSTQIDLLHSHDGMKPHAHDGYEFKKGDHKARPLTERERDLLDTVLGEWDKYRSGKR